MFIVAHLIKDVLGGYLSDLPIPYSLREWPRLGASDWARLVPFFAVVGGSSYLGYKAVRQSRHINHDIDKRNVKVGHAFDVEELGEKTSLCRCWRSKEFPYCDGAHKAHNLITGDNVGPVVVKRTMVPATSAPQA